MTEKELLDFCVENAGKLASGKYRVAGPNGLLKQSSKVVRGRIIAFTIDQYKNALVLLEDANAKEKKDLPNPLPVVPYKTDGWLRVVSPAKLGFPVYAESVVVDEQVSDQVSPTPVAQTVQSQSPQVPAQPQPKRICMHGECDPNWCHRQYSGVI